ncbi:unnamed protein product [Rhizoctonia solani]|uniref:CHAT domain-containing protein n=1 Tax=Rhizoctonia solani TaxID=456999 RepID=A0A8H3HV24_9AGAM|nr:unnamed protein product [Rhizoctonia solani]
MPSTHTTSESPYPWPTIGNHLLYSFIFYSFLHYNYFLLHFDHNVLRLQRCASQCVAYIRSWSAAASAEASSTDEQGLGIMIFTYRCEPDRTDYHARFHQSGNISDLDKDIECKSMAYLSLIQPGNPYLLGQLGRSYYCRFNHRGNPNDLEHSIQMICRAISLAPAGYRHLRTYFRTLADCHNRRFHLKGDIGDLDKDIAYKMKALQTSMAYEQPDLDLIYEIGRSYRTRFNYLGELTDLEHSIYCVTQTVSFTIMANRDPKSLVEQLNLLGAMHGQRFQRQGDLSDLDRQIECLGRALILLPQDHHDLPSQLNSLASSYDARYVRLRDVADLKKAIEYNVAALPLAEATGHPDQQQILTNLSTLSLSLYKESRDLADLEEGIEYSARAFSVQTSGRPARQGVAMLNNLSELYFARFKHLANKGDLDLSIECAARTIPLVSGYPEKLGKQYHKLGNYFHARWHHLRNEIDYFNAVKSKFFAVSLTPNDHPDYSVLLQSLSQVHLDMLGLSNSGSYKQGLRWALDGFRMSCLSKSGPPFVRLQSALKWARLSQCLSLVECLEAYQVAIDLIPHLVWLGKSVARRYDDINEFRNLASEAASIAIVAGNYELALEWLEQGRSIVMNQILTLQRPFDELHKANPVLAEHLQSTTEALRRTTPRVDNPLSVLFDLPILPIATSEEVFQRQMAKRHAELIGLARQLPGLNHLFQPKKVAELISTARTGPVVVINFYEPRYQCDALIVQPGAAEITHLSLPGFNLEATTKVFSYLESSLIRGRLTERGVSKLPIQGQTAGLENVLAILWKDVAKPILEFLKYKPNPSPENLPHITWCTTGILSSLPLHAAGIYRGSKICVADYAISSYTPTLTTLLSTSMNSAASSILAISQEETAGYSRLPGAAQELAYIREHANTNNSMSYTQLTDDGATTSAVLEMMERHDCIHFACHAHQSLEDPTKSGFFLHDGTLDLLSIMRRSFKNKGLAFLSACQTAQGDRRLPDEAIHLASGMLTAGYPSVIAAMWSVWDKDAPFVANKVYSMLLKDGKMDCRESARALHFAVAELRKEIGDDKLTRWVPFIHMGS